MNAAAEIAELVGQFERGEIDRRTLERSLTWLVGGAYDEGYAKGVEDTDYNWEMGV